MERSHTKNSTRIIIWIIAIVMAIGFVVSYFVIILENNNNVASVNQLDSQRPQLEVDPSAYVATEPVTKLEVVDLKAGTGAEASADDLITINYKGTLAKTGEKFESSFDTGTPITCKVSNFIEGWKQGIPGMKEAGLRRLVIPAAMAYGSQDMGTIPPNSDLVFEVELISVNPEGGVNQCEM